ncbi:hypothetical protein [Nocardia sp. NPDC057030]|uniref:hypothetical protein n=1 Tax=unclassified Nocardia TaxID=2637762 RepID=UPI00362AE91A
MDVTGTLPVGNGGTGGASQTLNNVLLGNGTGALQNVAPGTNGSVLRSDGTTWSSAGVNAFTTTATAAGTTTMTISSTNVQVWTGTTTQTVKLPTTSVVAGGQYVIINQSTGAVTVQSSGANTVTIVAAGTSAIFTAVVATPTAAADWNAQYLAGVVTSGKKLSVSNTLTLAGTDGTTFTFPGSSDTVAGLAAVQTITGAWSFNDSKLIHNGATSGSTTVNASATASGTLTLPAATDTLVARATTDTLTNKAITPRVNTTASSATPSINTDTTDVFTITALAAAITSMTSGLSGTPVNGQKLLIRIKDNGTARTITWGTSFVSSGIATLLSTTVISKTHLIGLIYDSTAAKWVCMACDPTGY